MFLPPASAWAAAPPASVVVRSQSDAFFLAGFEHFRVGRLEDARREWNACREIDESHAFCEFGLSVLDAGVPKAEVAPAPVTEAPGSPDQERHAQQSYLEGVIYYQKGDYEKARAAWQKAKALAPLGSDTEKEATAGLDKINTLYGTTPDAGEKAPKSLKSAPEAKDEHEALQFYFTGLIHYQKGDMTKARTEWKRALSLAPKGSSVETDARAALQRLDKDEASTGGDRKK